MRLKSLDVVGFKSFCDPTVISFSPGVTAVVGPNGCGKSNVVDAIRWVLGEQAPTRLRGKSAEDLIYAGNDSNAPAGMAEVTLLLEAEAGSTLPEPYAALSEIAVTRRVYRNGDSEYLINKIPCRLKDITEFFMAAQIHSRGYALVEQGRIDEIIQAKPIELRAMVEEAAGLSLFKGRREISERKLERVRENLARVDDVLSEIERQLNFARRQAKKAEAYKVIRAELGELDQLTSARRIFEQREELVAQSEREAELIEQSEAARALVETSQQAADESGARLASLRDRLANTERELANLRTAFEERARTRGFLERRLTNLNEMAPNLASRLHDLETQITAARAGRAFAGAKLAREKRADDSESESKLSQLRNSQREAEAALRQAEKRVEALKDNLSELIRQAAVTRGRLGDLSGERADNEQRMATVTEELPRLAEVLNTARGALAQATEVNLLARDGITAREAEQRETSEREFQLRSALEQSNQALAAARQRRDRALVNARRIMPNGASERLSSVLQSLNGDGPATRPPMLLEVMKAPPALEPALRAVLGEQLDGVIIQSPNFALRAVEILKQQQAGRMSFIPEAIQATGTPHQAIDAPGIAGRLLDMVEVEPRYAPMAEALMGHVMVADDLRSAQAASNLNGRGTVFVTRDGDLLSPDHLISGGSGVHIEDEAELGMRQRALTLEAAERAVVEAEADHEVLVRQSEWARLAVRDEIEGMRRAKAHLVETERRLDEARNQVAKAEQRLALAEANRASLERRSAEVVNLVQTANGRLEELARLEQEAREKLSDAANDLARNREEATRLGEETRALAARVETRKAALAALAQELRHQRDKAAGLETQIRRHHEEIARAATERAEFEQELAGLAAQDEVAQSRVAELATAAETLTQAVRETEKEVEASRAQLKSAREQSTALESEATQCQIRRERARTLIEEYERGFTEKFQAMFDDRAHELREQLANRDPEADANRLAELRTRAERIGEVNLAAESEVRELEERSSALNAERADLKAAADDLAHTIQKLNREARRRFAETFEGAARNFEELFPKLMRGGKGRLELTEADDVLEAGVNILVQPVGKKVKEIGLLSGGEKALSAMALIFSLFLLNPSPFCVMDEVDAPLDEFSLAAFTTLVRELKARSQFIIITHNQRTMQAADHIHGVTMERPGISRLISLTIPQAA